MEQSMLANQAIQEPIDPALVTLAEPKLFKLIGGIHYENHPNFKLNAPGTKGFGASRSVKYTKGAIISSDRDLVKIFPNKFEEAIAGVNIPAIVTAERKTQVAKLIQDGVWQEVDRDFLEKLSDKDLDRLNKRFGPQEESKKVPTGLKTPAPK